MTQRHRQLEEIEHELRVTSKRAHDLAESVGESQFLKRPVETSWSMAECIAHLTITTRAFLPIIDSALASTDGIDPDPTRPFKPDVMGRVLRWMLEPPYRMRVKTPASFVPEKPSLRDTVLIEFDDGQAQLVERLHAADGKPLDMINVVSPFNASMKYNLYACLNVIPAHQRRHLWQAEQIRSKFGNGAAT